MKYDKDLLYDMCQSIDLLEYASNTIDFQKRGKDSYAAHCPKHQDDTPSLFITPSKNAFHCFSCGRSGYILQWLMLYEGLDFEEAINKVSKLSGVDINNLKKCDALIFYKELCRIYRDQYKPPNILRKIYPDSYLNEFLDLPPEEWVSEGISPEIMKKYKIRIDMKNNRIVYPVYDNDGNLIGVKGRTRFKNYKLMGITKYQNYQQIGTTDFFTGMLENKKNIQEKNQVIIFEGIKSGMKVEGWGYNYWLASETSCLNEDQIRILIQLNVKDVIIAFDNDVKIEKIRHNMSKLRKFTNVYAIYDRFALLGDPKEKLSPCDKGKDIFEVLLRQKIKL